MTGAMLALAGAATSGGGGGGGGGGTLGALAWAAIYGPTSGANAPLTIAGITSAHTLAATISGGANLSYTLNGVVAPYTGAFAVNAGDTLSWTVSKLIRRSGTIAVTDTSNGGAAVDSFDYILTGPE